MFAQSSTLDFSVAQGGNNASILSWSSDDATLSGFYIEKSLDGKNFFQIAFVEHDSDLPTAQAYGYIDYDFAGPATYRLREASGSEIKPFQEVNAMYSSTLDVEVYPNPVINDHVSLSGPSDVDFMVLLTDLNGSTVFNSTGQLNEIETILNHELPGLQASVYFLRIESSLGTSISRLVKK